MDKISPAILIIIVILAVIIFLSALLHFLVRFILKRSIFSSVSHSSRFIESSSGTHPPLRRQLQQLFRLQDSGLDQALIDSLPVFYYKDIMGLKEPFDCAVCLCEFSEDDKLRLLPICSHAFHITCIDTWLLSNSTCPLCRGTILSSGLHFENTLFNFSNHRELQSNSSCDEQCASNQEDRVKDALSVRLGSFKILNGGGESGVIYQEESGRHKNLDARRCYSMGSHQYVVGDLELQVAMSNVNGTCALNGDRKISCRIENESFSVSKVWK